MCMCMCIRAASHAFHIVRASHIVRDVCYLHPVLSARRVRGVRYECDLRSVICDLLTRMRFAYVYAYMQPLRAGAFLPSQVYA